MNFYNFRSKIRLSDVKKRSYNKICGKYCMEMYAYTNIIIYDILTYT